MGETKDKPVGPCDHSDITNRHNVLALPRQAESPDSMMAFVFPYSGRDKFTEKVKRSLLVVYKGPSRSI